MKFSKPLVMIFLGFAIPMVAYSQQQKIKIALKNGDSLEITTRNQLLVLIEKYNLYQWSYTKSVIIDSDPGTVPHSHPILTLNTRHSNDDQLLLATYLHEQLHWYLDDHPKKGPLLETLKSLYPHPRIQFPDGSGGEIDTYYHVAICHFEYKLLKHVLGELKAYQVITFWQRDHYKWIYKIVIEDDRQLNTLMHIHSLVP